MYTARSSCKKGKEDASGSGLPIIDNARKPYFLTILKTILPCMFHPFINTNPGNSQESVKYGARYSDSTQLQSRKFSRKCEVWCQV